MKKILSTVLAANISLFAFSTSNISVLNGEFDGDSAIYDTNDGGKKTTITFEHLTKDTWGDIFFFVDYTVADDTKLYSSDKTGLYGEFMPRFSLSNLTNTKLSNSVVKDVFIATQLNAGSGSDFRAELVGLGTDLNVPGFDFFQMNAYYKHVDLTISSVDYSRDTYQISPVYGTHFGSSGISFQGWMDLSGYSYSTQNQLLYDVMGNGKIKVGIEHLYYYETKSDNGTNNHPETSSVQLMAKFSW
ncbi:outer membrane protein OmpK [Poseidonibacter antarcticus]|uniref:outer membrane protein OmpK n=1 Tax=Poseidonibacter antarcticus TaxID=2478538 RepID=UPI000EF4CAB4|nr:outer membrane protein OmpK [Poseidonibacter antarcticus]